MFGGLERWFPLLRLSYMQIAPAIIGGAVAGLGSLFGGLFSSSSQLEAQKEANKANKEIAGAQMAFQERMSSSAHQREVADLRAAGLNPILSANGGASSPGGASLSVNPEVNRAGEAVAGAVSSAFEKAMIVKELEQKDAGIDAARATAAASKADAELKRVSAKNAGLMTEALDAEGKLRKDTAEFDRGAVKFDGYSKRVLDAIGGFYDAANVMRIVRGNPGNLEKNHKFLEKQGAKGALIRGRKLP